MRSGTRTAINHLSLGTRYPKKKKKLKNGKRHKTRMQKRADKLNKNVPMSEKWFRAKFKREPLFKHFDFLYNFCFGSFIIDVHCGHLKICIEVDGSFHNSEEQQWKDRKKDKYITGRGFQILRVKSGDNESYSNCVNAVLETIKTIRPDLKLGLKESPLKESIELVDFEKKLPF